MSKQEVYITNVRKGRPLSAHGQGPEYVYAQVRDLETDELLIAATLDYCLEEAYARYEVCKADH